jgi:hypothetical protein
MTHLKGINIVQVENRSADPKARGRSKAVNSNTARNDLGDGQAAKYPAMPTIAARLTKSMPSPDAPFGDVETTGEEVCDMVGIAPVPRTLAVPLAMDDSVTLADTIVGAMDVVMLEDAEADSVAVVVSTTRSTVRVMVYVVIAVDVP